MVKHENVKLSLNLSVHSDPASLGRMKPLGIWSRLVCLYSSPQVKFYWNIVSYFTFLFLFAVVLMIDFQVTPSAWEMLLYIWLFSLVCEEVRQVRGCRWDTHIVQTLKHKSTYILRSETALHYRC